MGSKYASIMHARRKTDRRCLKCNRKFGSTGSGNRLCPKCNVANLHAPKLGDTPIHHQLTGIYR